MCTKCLKEELLFCAPIPPPKKKGKLKKKKTEGEIVPIDQVLISNEQVEETQNAIEPAPMVLVNGDLITVTPLSSPPPQAYGLPCLIVIDLCKHIQQGLGILDSLVMRLGCYDVVNMMGPEENEITEVLSMYAASDISIMLVTSADTPATMNTMQSILQHTSSHKCLWVQVNAAANMASSTVPLLYYPSVTQNNARRGGQASKINNSARAILHSVLDGKTWRGSMDVYPNVQSMVIGSAGQINNEVVTDQLLEKVLLFLWLP